MSGKIFIIEGMDYTGKTTVAKKLAEHYDGMYIHSPTGSLVDPFVGDVYDILKEHPDMRRSTKAALMLACNIECCRGANEAKENGETVFMDRSIFSMYPYQKISINELKAMTTLFNFEFPNFDEMFLLTADVSSILLRHELRDSDNLDDYFLANMERIRKNYQNLAMQSRIHFNTGFVEVDTTELAISETLAEIRAHIDKD